MSLFLNHPRTHLLGANPSSLNLWALGLQATWLQTFGSSALVLELSLLGLFTFWIMLLGPFSLSEGSSAFVLCWLWGSGPTGRRMVLLGVLFSPGSHLLPGPQPLSPLDPELNGSFTSAIPRVR